MSCQSPRRIPRAGLTRYLTSRLGSLGQIEYIFSDKTGTLTQNAMIFQQCSIAGVVSLYPLPRPFAMSRLTLSSLFPSAQVYKGDGKIPEGTEVPETKHVGGPGSDGLTMQVSSNDTAINDSGSSDQALKSDAGKDTASVAEGIVKVKLPKDVLATFHSDELDQTLQDHDSENFTNVAGFFTNLALCHTAMAVETHGVIEYTAQSPDESALYVSSSVFLILERLS